jgi:adenine-specific DNA-methyltransferase
MPAALAQVVADVDCDLLILSYNDESWLTLEQLVAMCAHHETVTTLSFDSPRYVGARIGIHNPVGERVGTVSHLRNHEYLVLAGSPGAVELATGAAERWLA